MMEQLDYEQTNSGLAPKRYTPQEQQAIYLWWRTAGGRSINKTAKRFGCDYHTVSNWVKRDNWESRANAEDQDEFASSRIGVAAIVVNELVPSIETAVQIRDNLDNDPKVRLASAQWLAGLAGVSPVSKIETSVVQAPKQSDVVDVQSLAGMSPDELMQLEQQARSKRQSG